MAFKEIIITDYDKRPCVSAHHILYSMVAEYIRSFWDNGVNKIICQYSFYEFLQSDGDISFTFLNIFVKVKGSL